MRTSQRSAFVRTRLLTVVLALAIVCASCDPVLRPRADPLRDLQHAAGADTGTLTGAVFVVPLGWIDTANIWLAPRSPVPGAIVELGLWAGTPASYRDSLGAGPPSDFRDPRFTVIASVVTDGNAKWHVSGIPRKTVFAMRVRAPARVAADSAYLGTLFWLYSSPTMDLPIVLRRVRRPGA